MTGLVPDREPADELDRWPTATSRDALAWEMAQHYGDDQELLRDLVSAVLEIRSLRARLGDTDWREIRMSAKDQQPDGIRLVANYPDGIRTAFAVDSPKTLGEIVDYHAYLLSIPGWRSVDGSGDPK